MEEGRLSRISFSEGLVPNIDSSLFRLANVLIPRNNADSFRVRWPMRSGESQSFTKAPQSQFRLEVDVDDH